MIESAMNEKYRPDSSDANPTGQSISNESDRRRAELASVLEHGYSATALIAELKKNARIGFLFEQDSRIAERYTIEEHTEMVLGQFERYLAAAPLPAGITRSELRLVLALHDIGKSIPPNKEDQHRATVEVIESLRAELPLSDSGWAIGKILIDNDLIGEVIRAGIAQSATLVERQAIGARAKQEPLALADLQKFADLVKFKPYPGDTDSQQAWAVKYASGAGMVSAEAARLGLRAPELMNLMVLFYQSDTAAYSYDALTVGGRRASPGLDFLFSFNGKFALGTDDNLLVKDAATGLLKFSPDVEKILGGLEEAVRQAAGEILN